MPETPDFRQMARDLTWTEDYGASPIGAIEEQLRLVWNARGAADIAKLEAAFDGVQPSMKTLDHALRSLDR